MATIVISVVLVLSWVAMYALYQNKKKREAKEGQVPRPMKSKQKALYLGVYQTKRCF